MTEVVVWNINRKQQALEELVAMGADPGFVAGGSPRRGGGGSHATGTVSR